MSSYSLDLSTYCKDYHINYLLKKDTIHNKPDTPFNSNTIFNLSHLSHLAPRDQSPTWQMFPFKQLLTKLDEDCSGSWGNELHTSTFFSLIPNDQQFLKASSSYQVIKTSFQKTTHNTFSEDQFEFIDLDVQNKQDNTRIVQSALKKADFVDY